MANDKDVYEQLAQMVDEEDVVGAAQTPALLKLIGLYFTPEEAQLALQMRLSSVRLGEIAAKTGIGEAKLKKMLWTMADKGTVFIEPGQARQSPPQCGPRGVRGLPDDRDGRTPVLFVRVGAEMRRLRTSQVRCTTVPMIRLRRVIAAVAHTWPLKWWDMSL